MATVGDMRKSTIYVAVPPLGTHPSNYVVRDLRRALVASGATPIAVANTGSRYLSRMALPLPRRPHRRPIIVPMMGTRFDLLFRSAVHGTPVPFIWDLWEPRWKFFVRRLRLLNLPLVVVTAKDSAEFLRGHLPGTVVECLPEATLLSRYQRGSELASRPIDVLELGRQNPKWHRAISPAIASDGRRHAYESTPGQLVFKDESELISGLAAAKISVCFPSSITHPQRSGSVTTMTHRYLESLASRCLVLGRCPPELSELFGFDPVIAVDDHDPSRQLRAILTNIDSFQVHVDRAHTRLQSVGDWQSRVHSLLALVQKHASPSNSG